MPIDMARNQAKPNIKNNRPVPEVQGELFGVRTSGVRADYL